MSLQYGDQYGETLSLHGIAFMSLIYRFHFYKCKCVVWMYMNIHDVDKFKVYFLCLRYCGTSELCIPPPIQEMKRL